MRYSVVLRYFLLFLWSYFGVFCQSLAQNPIRITDNTPLLPIGKSLAIYQDNYNHITAKNLTNPTTQAFFQAHKEEIGNFHLTDDAIWLRFSVENASKEPLYLLFNNGFIDDIQLYGVDSTQKATLLTHTGDIQPFNTRQWAVSKFVFLLPNSYHTFYVKCQSRGVVQIPLLVGTLTKVTAYLHHWDLWQGFFMGLAFIIFIYNLLIYSKLKDIIYLVYCGYIVIVTFNIGQLNGLTFEWLWQSYPKINHYENIIYSLSIIGVIFTAMFLRTAEYAPKLHKLQYFTGSIYLFTALMSIAGFYREANALAQVGIFLNSILSLVLAIVIALKGYKPAIFFLFSWSFLLVGLITFILTMLGIFPANQFTLNAVQIGSTIEMILLSVAITQKIDEMNEAKEEAEKAQAAALARNEKLIKDQFILLERKVQERTFELQQTKEEVITQNQELRQQQEEIIAQRDLIYSQNTNLERQNQKISAGIKASLTIQKGILPNAFQLEAWLQEYFVFYQPKDIVSGDLYWFAGWIKPNGNFVKVLAAIDCTGHGVQGALTSMIARTLFDEVVLLKQQENPAKILEEVHMKVETIFNKEQNNVIETGMDVAICVCTHNTKQNHVKVNFAGAKRPLYYVLPNERQTHIVQGSRKSIGGRQKKVYDNHLLELPANTMLYLCSDGYADQNNAQRESFGLGNFEQLLAEIASQSCENQLDTLSKKLNTFMDNTEQRDDILVWGVRLVQ